MNYRNRKCLFMPAMVAVAIVLLSSFTPSAFGVDPQKGIRLNVRACGDVIGDVLGREAEWVGTKGQSLTLRGFQISIDESIPGLGVKYRGHFQDVGDTPWVQGGEYLSHRGRLEGIAVELTGPEAKKYTVMYQVHMAGHGDSQVFSDGHFAGTRGESRRVEAIVIIIMPKQ